MTLDHLLAAVEITLRTLSLAEDLRRLLPPGSGRHRRPDVWTAQRLVPHGQEKAMATYFHTTDAAEAILREGFRDSEGSYMLVGMTLRGVFLADVPLDVNEGAKGEDVLEVVLPDGLDLADYEIVDGTSAYREWCVPAEVINRQGSVRLLSPEEAGEASARWLQARRDQSN